MLSLVTVKTVVFREAAKLHAQWISQQEETCGSAVMPNPQSETPMSDSTSVSPTGTPFTRTNTASSNSTCSDDSFSDLASSVVS